jgi:ferric-dicitrate binding protein FerR (iron transport regulator)
LEVAKNTAKPFIIHSYGGLQTTVLGTSFNLKAYPELDEQVVSVLK